jgi:hypothetical protein
MSAPYEKAVEETAKAVQKVADGGRELGAFAKLVLGPGFIELGGAFTDWAKVFRHEQALKLAHRVSHLHKRRGIEARTVPIPPRLGIPLLQQATLEDDETLLDLWASLIANATDPNRMTEARRSYCGLLSSMEPLDALVLKEVYRWKEANPGRDTPIAQDGLTDEERQAYVRRWPNITTLVADLAAPESNVALSLESLQRLGLVYDYLPLQELGEDDEARQLLMIPAQTVPVTYETALIDLTHTGLALMAACSD